MAQKVSLEIKGTHWYSKWYTNLKLIFKVIKMDQLKKGSLRLKVSPNYQTCSLKLKFLFCYVCLTGNISWKQFNRCKTTFYLKMSPKGSNRLLETQKGWWIVTSYTNLNISFNEGSLDLKPQGIKKVHESPSAPVDRIRTNLVSDRQGSKKVIRAPCKYIGAQNKKLNSLCGLTKVNWDSLKILMLIKNCQCSMHRK